MSVCDCKTVCCLHVHADLMLEMIYRYAGECAECDGEGKIEIDLGGGDYREEPCRTCSDIRDLIKRVDPCGDRLAREERLAREFREEPGPPRGAGEDEIGILPGVRLEGLLDREDRVLLEQGAAPSVFPGVREHKPDRTD